MSVIICVFVWLLLAIVATINFTKPIRFSDIERRRLVSDGDVVAKYEADYLADKPLLESLQQIVRALLVVGFVMASVLSFGYVVGVLVAVAGLLLVPIAFRLPFICNLSDKLRDRSTPFMGRVVSSLRPFLRWLRDREVATGEITLNSQAELLELIKHSSGVLSKDELARLQASLAFDNRTVASVMTPRSMIDGVKAEDTLGPLVMDELYKTGHSRFPVYKGDLDHVVGMIYLHDLLDLKSGNAGVDKTMQKKVYYIHENKDLSHALHGFITTHHHLFVVVNDYRETVGLLSLEDVIEVLIGKKIVDEFDSFDDLRAVAEHNPKKNNLPENKQDV